MLHLKDKNYFINSEDGGFSSRQKSIFDQLDAVVKKNELENPTNSDVQVDTTVDEGMDVDVQTHSHNLKRKRGETKHLKGKESIFKRPEPPPPARFKNNMPDFKRNPHKWTKYTLSDVSQDDMSDQSNTAAAMAFLREIQDKKTEPGESEQANEKIVFKRPKKKPDGGGLTVIQVSNEESPGEDGTSYFRGSKLVMPEYVVGQKVAKKKKTQSNDDKKSNKPQGVSLNHLNEYDDGDEEES